MLNIIDRFRKYFETMRNTLRISTKYEDKITLGGIMDFKVKRHGQVIDMLHEENLIVNIAKDTLARLLGGDGAGKSIAKLAAGTNSSAAAPTDTAITNSFVKAVDGHTYPASGQVKFTWTIDSNEANGKEIWEFGLLCGDDTLFARKVRSNHPIYKDDEITIEGSWTIVL